MTPVRRARPLTILVAGAGIGGLTAAIALRQQGHVVKIFEQSQFAAELGAAIHLAPNSNGILRRLGIYAENFGSNPCCKFTELDGQGKVIRSMDVRESNKLWQHPWHLAHRVHLHDALKKAATSAEGKGRPAELHTRSKIKAVDEAQGTLMLDNGQIVEGDVVVGADGVHSVTRTRIAPDTKPFGCGKSAFRFLIARSQIEDDPLTSPLVGEEGELKIWYESDRRIVMYPTSNNQLFNFVCIHPATESNTSADWNQGASMETIQKVYSSFEPGVEALLRKADPDTLKVWSLLDMDEIPVWNKDRLALLGDAAHPFLPHQGQGAGTAIEDGAALATVLPLGTKREEVAERLRLYDEIRHERATKIQTYSRIIGGDDLMKKKDLDMIKFTNYNFGHDEFDHASQRFREYQWSLVPNKYWRMPIAFGPMPGPRQNHLGHPRSGEQSTFTTASIRFKTSRTALQNLFPPDRSGYRFTSPGTMAYASFSQTTLNGMEWLGGSGYNHLGLYTHGVEYTSASGKTVRGTYLPILFENLADPIVSGREELGMPKLYSGIDIFQRGEGSYHIRTSWQGAVWGHFHLTGLESVDPQQTAGSIGGEADDGIIVHRYMPSVGKENKGVKSEADFACFDPFAEAEPKPRVTAVWTASQAKFEINGLDWKSLPTLNHVVSRLEELPVYEVVGAKVVEGLGVPDVSGARPV
ncbi:hypothetical protein M409DRAFT_69143 [Zasmidium cellare ATCC 36951]|uniref:FAD-binding domain-containing protein n=1 Tax=Zasmidium cellare ATCC 36951 TaxID=1080233 RepID=A0A6A6C647_ZASCE|nr:uncharacterized protein M409DRAFT_69143 [Zasmidium cellare ATCC 36951]KAF2162584.1 hypothetical protein M409DRAFT_69143 [Zasmidium cellare ATCC 36951]